VLPAAEARAPPAPPSPQSEAAHAQSLELLSAARDRRHWTSEDASALHRLMPQMTQEQCDDILHTLLPALNRGEITADFAGRPPF
jgi:hypothetical protein